MWIVLLALRRPYTFVVSSILAAILGILSIRAMPTDIFPEIDIPVVSIIFNYSGMPPEDMEKRVVSLFERFLTTTVNDIEHIESQSLYGIGLIKVFLQKHAKIEAATAQITAVSQTAIRQMPPGSQPPLILRYSASSVPIIQLSLASKTIPEQQLFDLGINTMRPQLITLPGVQIPYPYGGKQRQILVDLDPEKLYAWGISPGDVSSAVNNQNLILPAGTTKIGKQEYQVRLNSSPETVQALNDLPIKVVNGVPVYLKDIAQARDGFAVQTNLVHVNGKRGVLTSILKSGSASTLDVVNSIKSALPRIKQTLPEAFEITPLFDQSLFVRAAVEGVVREGLIAAGLTALMILLFLGSWRSTLIVVTSIPLSILVSIILLYFMGETLNVMTLGGMALAVGILVDDATVEIENIHRNLHQKKRLVRAILDGAQQIAIPAFVSTLCICIVFIPVVFVSGAAKYLFTPLAMAVVFAMMTSYLLSRTLVPTMVHYLLASEVELYGGELDPQDPHAAAAIHDKELRTHGEARAEHHPLRERSMLIRSAIRKRGSRVIALGIAIALGIWLWASGLSILAGLTAAGSFLIEHRDTLIVLFAAALVVYTVGPTIVRQNLIWRTHEWFNRKFEHVRLRYTGVLAWCLDNRKPVLVSFAVFFLFSAILFPFVGKDFFPSVDAGLLRLHVRAPAGTRLEETEHYFARIEDLIRTIIPPEEISVILNNLGIPNSGINLALSDGTMISPADGEILVALNKGHASTWNYLTKIRQALSARFPDATYFFSPADIATQVLNFGLSAPIDIQIAGPGPNQQKNLEIAQRIMKKVATIHGAVDVHLGQIPYAPLVRVNVDRTLAGKIGLTQRDVASDLLISLSSSTQTAPNFWLNPVTGINYSVLVQTPQYRMGSINALANTPVIPETGSGIETSQLLSNVASFERGVSPGNITHYNISPTYDVLLNVQGADLGSVSKAVRAVVAEISPDLPRGSFISLRGQIESMSASFAGLSYGLIFAVLLVYLLMVINFQSWLDPLIILTALPAALSGIVWMLFVTGTTVSVPALMGSIMCIGVATSNSILMITFANDQRALGLNAREAALTAGFTRLRPVIMTALAMIIGMLPMSLGLSEGGEQNAPLGRAVIGGLVCATLGTLIFVPLMYSTLRTKEPQTQVEEELR